MESSRMLNIKFDMLPGVQASYTLQGDNKEDLIAEALEIRERLALRQQHQQEQREAAQRADAPHGEAQAPRTPGSPRDASPDGTAFQQDPCCPIHRTAKQGRNGLYCPRKQPDGTWCDWTHPSQPTGAQPPAPRSRRRSNGNAA